MNVTRVLFILFLMLVGCQAGIAGSDIEALQGVTDVLDRQVGAWNRGDLDQFMTGYLQSPEASYVSGADEVWGYDALLRRYQKRYGSSRDTMGKLAFSDLKVVDLGRDNALCIGRWQVERVDKPSVKGVFSLIFVRTASGWKIMHDHTSVAETKH